MSTSTISPSPNAPPEKSTSVTQTTVVPVEEEESDEVENDDVENDDNVIVEDIIKAHSNPGQAFVPLKREVDEDRDFKELYLLISSKEELVAKLRDQSPGFLSNQPRSNPVIWDQAEDTSLN